MDLVQAAATLATKQPKEAIKAYKNVLNTCKLLLFNSPVPSLLLDEQTRIKVLEQTIYALGDLYNSNKYILFNNNRLATELADLVRSCQTLLVNFPKAKTAKMCISLGASSIVKTLIDQFTDIPNSLSLQIQICKAAIDWAVNEKRIFLRQALETRLASLYILFLFTLGIDN